MLRHAANPSAPSELLSPAGGVNRASEDDEVEGDEEPSEREGVEVGRAGAGGAEACGAVGRGGGEVAGIAAKPSGEA